MKEEFKYNDRYLYDIHHRNYIQEKETADSSFWLVAPAAVDMPERRVVLANQPRLIREMMIRILGRTPGLQVVPQPVLWPNSQPGSTKDRINWLILSQSAASLSDSYMLPVIRACNPLSILIVSKDVHHVSIQPHTEDGPAIQRDYYNITLDMLLSILLYAPEASQSYTQASYN